MFRSASNVDNATLAVKTQFLFLRSVISTLYCRHLATDAAIRLFSLRTAPSITNHTWTRHSNGPMAKPTGSQFLHMDNIGQSTALQTRD
jgi:hypothetical protein